MHCGSRKNFFKKMVTVVGNEEEEEDATTRTSVAAPIIPHFYYEFWRRRRKRRFVKWRERGGSYENHCLMVSQSDLSCFILFILSKTILGRQAEKRVR